MINLLNETINVMQKYGKCVADVKFIGCTLHNFRQSDINVRTDWAHFTKIADFVYDNGYGLEEIPLGLVVVGTDWWLERHEYDGAEWWEFKEMPNINDYCYDEDFEKIFWHECTL